MEIKKFDYKSDDIDAVAGLILQGYSESSKETLGDEESRIIVKDLIEAGNNFIGQENIYLGIIEKNIAGLIVGYTGKSQSKLKTLLNLLLRLRITQVFNFMIVSSQLFDTAYTPDLKENDFYISVIVVSKEYRNRGVGSFLLKESIQLAKSKNCKQIVLDVDKDNTAAQSLYKKAGFIKNKSRNTDSLEDINETMVLTLN